MIRFTSLCDFVGSCLGMRSRLPRDARNELQNNDDENGYTSDCSGVIRFTGLCEFVGSCLEIQSHAVSNHRMKCKMMAMKLNTPLTIRGDSLMVCVD